MVINKFCPRTEKLLYMFDYWDDNAIIYGHINSLVAYSKEAFKSWSKISSLERGEYIRKIADVMETKREYLASAIKDDMGKSCIEDAFPEVDASIKLARFYAGEGSRLYGKTCNSGILNRVAMTIREPIGIAALITPFNVPIAGIAWKLFPALLCGNTVIVKPSELATESALRLLSIVSEVLPQWVVTSVIGKDDVVKILVTNKDISIVSFTGSTKAGLSISKLISGNVKLSLEMGGKNSLVVCEDSNFERAIECGFNSAFGVAGQRCVSADKIVVHSSIYNKYRDCMVDLVNDRKDDIDPVITIDSLDNCFDIVEHARYSGFSVKGGARRNRAKNGYFFEPAVIDNHLTYHDLNNREFFGPIVALYKFNTLDDAIDIVNSSDYGLSSGIHTNNINNIIKFYKSVNTGVVTVNDNTYGSEPHMPFGGNKLSGNGVREPGTEAIDFYTNLKDVYIQGVFDEV